MVLFWSCALGLVSMVSFGLANATSKHLIARRSPANVLFARGVTTVAVLALVTLAQSGRLSGHLTAALAAFVLGMAGYLPVLAFTRGIQISHLGVVSPIAATSPLVTVMLSAVCLDVAVPALTWVAIAVVIGANVWIAVDPADWRRSRVLDLSSGVPHALVAAAGWGMFFFALVPLVRALGPWLAPFLAEAGVVAAASLHARGDTRPPTLRDALDRHMVANGALVASGVTGFTYGVEHFDVGVVSALSNSTAVVTTALGALLFHERLSRKDRAAAALLIVGVCLLSASS